jgi:hypothetical protein
MTVKTGPDWWNRTYVIFTGLLVGVGICGVLYARKSLNAIESQLERMKEQVAQMKSSGKQTDTLIATMQDNGLRQLRAYFCVSVLAVMQAAPPSPRKAPIHL